MADSSTVGRSNRRRAARKAKRRVVRLSTRSATAGVDRRRKQVRKAGERCQNSTPGPAEAVETGDAALIACPSEAGGAPLAGVPMATARRARTLPGSHCVGIVWHRPVLRVGTCTLLGKHRSLLLCQRRHSLTHCKRLRQRFTYFDPPQTHCVAMPDQVAQAKQEHTAMLAE